MQAGPVTMMLWGLAAKVRADFGSPPSEAARYLGERAWHLGMFGVAAALRVEELVCLTLMSMSGQSYSLAFRQPSR